MASDPIPTESELAEDTVIQGHNYDGIEEYDNPMPGWWLWIFWISVIIAPIYLLGVHAFGFINTYEDDLSAGRAELQQIRDQYAQANPSIQTDEATLATFVDDPDAVQAGAALFATNCLACHGAQGQGLIGPNLTDDYWIHGNSNTDIYNVITNGVLEKGMTPWNSILSVEQRAQLVSYVQSIRGTNPPGAKEPQGEFVPGA